MILHGDLGIEHPENGLSWLLSFSQRLKRSFRQRKYQSQFRMPPGFDCHIEIVYPLLLTRDDRRPGIRLISQH